ncbi:hypothetical protein GXW71_05050 [Roseomonas hellenica]|uniref:Lipoprotein n=1 Tax=Plastoroseomonas hellenica TaxID=2687306 RepID=A0ABS5EUU4_9PROT|nr:hypothetical protein [Plastoroseomonas hellenica]MBR0663720.1 hypothetical protein [Plastoroseomonas hellenica]
MHRRLLLTGAGLGLLGLAGCRLAPIHTVTDGAFRGSAPLPRRGDQIRRAAIRLGWQVQDIRPGLMRATFSARRDQAVVEIAYTRDQFSIRHLESTNLSFDGTQINRAYNGWVQDLERGIVAASAS